MSDPSTQSGDNLPVKKSDETVMALVAYILYLVFYIGIVIGPLIGVVIAYVKNDGAPAWLASHYQFQIRTFWIALGASIIAGLLIFIFIGWILSFVVAVWFIIRCVRGIIWLQNGEAVPEPTSWLFGTSN